MLKLLRFPARLAAGLLLTIAVLSGCASAPGPEAAGKSGDANTEKQEESGTFFTLTDDANRTVVLPSRPERIVVLSPQLLDLLYDIGGSAIARTSSAGAAVPEKAKDITDVGGITSVNTEKLLSLKPDLVIGSPSFHRELAAVLDSSHIPFALFNLSTYQELKQKVPLFGKLSGKESEAAERLAKLDEQIRALTGKVPDKQPTFIMLNVTPSSVSVQRANTIGLEVAGMLRMNNVAESLQASQTSQTTAPYSLEKIVELDPDYVFILIHGARGDGEKKIQSDLAAQPAWASLRAVKEKRMTILPSDLLLSNPGFRLNESVLHLAKYVYPDQFDAK
ncbi:ABC transporter substrate-binding protein [Paenibacillus ginsengarvi]|uniref:ABC transporter substrate-binding protein n=1 Tax=Paenibacillus ginsengarvi TaxID=400777 RepID=A0A3B0CGE6_9BACL|nr:ABC transporter substrate-binding protein [Paenibacillus ginsengarvi]RKN84422.1 ABC transporter substrate-binding protein [Paenibacillus ginsengarvi]